MLNSGTFPSSQKGLPHASLQSVPVPTPNSLAITNLLSVSIDLPFLDIAINRIVQQVTFDHGKAI